MVLGGKIVKDVKFAHNQGMVTGSEKGLQQLMNRLNDTAKNFKMKINVQKNGSDAQSRRWCRR